MPLQKLSDFVRQTSRAQIKRPTGFHRLSLENPFGLTVLILFFGVVWLAHLSSVALTAPMDNIEQWVWSHSLQWGYHKHPPLPTWLLSWPQKLSSATSMTSQILGALCTLTSALIFTNLIRQIWGARSAAIALLAALCITFYNGRLNYYNHNVLLMLCVSLSVYCWWMILTTGRTRWWVGLGFSAGLGMLSKYQYALVLAPSAVMIWQLKPWHNKQHLKGIGWALVTATLLFLPHLLWLLQQDMADSPIRYALKTSLPDYSQNALPSPGRIRSGIWLLDLLLNRCLPAILFLLLVKPLRQADISNSHATDHPDAGSRFLLTWGILPPLCITLLGLVMGMDLQMQWGTAFAIWIVPPLMVLLKLHRANWPQKYTGVILVIFGLVQGMLMLHSYQTSAFGCCANTGSPRWRLFNSTEIAKELEHSACEAVGGRFRIIAGGTTTAGAIAIAMKDHPKVLIDDNLKISPWIQAQELQGPGVIRLWAPNTGPETRTRLPSGWGWSLY